MATNPPLPEVGPGFGNAVIFDISGDGNTLAGSVIENGSVLRSLIYDRPSQTYTILAPAVPYGDFEIPLRFNHLDAIKVDPEGLVEYLGVTDFSQDPPIDFAWASATNADGTVIVGNRTRQGNPYALEPWRLAGGVITPLAARGVATFVTGNGDRVAGSACFAWLCSEWRDEEAFCWTEETGLEDFAKVLAEEWGVDLGGWRLLEISDMSDDGLVLGGRAKGPDGQLGFFLARLPQTVEMKLLPEPVTTLGLLLGSAALSALKRRRDRGARRPAGSPGWRVRFF
ncbi:MAG: PEP-CTERM sorting domain-containing protein [bacterium]|nr:PEP-CTERM sorting domain-containing protein [bacterium]